MSWIEHSAKALVGLFFTMTLAAGANATAASWFSHIAANGLR